MRIRLNRVFDTNIYNTCCLGFLCNRISNFITARIISLVFSIRSAHDLHNTHIIQPKSMSYMLSSHLSRGMWGFDRSGHVVGQNNSISPRGNEIYFHVKTFCCFCPKNMATVKVTPLYHEISNERLNDEPVYFGQMYI